MKRSIYGVFFSCQKTSIMQLCGARLFFDGVVLKERTSSMIKSNEYTRRTLFGTLTPIADINANSIPSRDRKKNISTMRKCFRGYTAGYNWDVN